MENKMKKIVRFGIIMCLSLIIGCSNGDKNIFELSLKNESIVVLCNGEEFVILDERVEVKDLGNVVGEINKIVSGTMFSTVYQDKHDDDILDISIDNYFVKAIKKENLKMGQTIYTLQDKTVEEEVCYVGELKVNSNNATQLISETGKVYQITDEIISEEQLDLFLTSVSDYVVYDSNTKKVILSERLSKIDWTGEKKGESRVARIYTDVYTLKLDKNSIAVNVDEKYHIAKLMK